MGNASAELRRSSAGWSCSPHNCLAASRRLEPLKYRRLRVEDANGQALAYVYARETKADADIAKVLTLEEARRVASKSPSYRRCCHANRCRAAESIPGLPKSRWQGRKLFAACGVSGSILAWLRSEQACETFLLCGQMLRAVAAAPYGRLRTYRRPPQLCVLFRRQGHYAKMARDD